MNNLKWLTDVSLTTSDFNETTEFMIPDMIAEKMITLIYANGGNGKSYLNQSLAKWCAITGFKTFYLDFDNPMSVLVERNIDNNMVAYNDNLYYIQRSKYSKTPQELIDQLEANAHGQSYREHIIFIDSLRNFVDVKNDSQTMRVLNQLMNLREAGATIVILHHSNKDGRNYEGSNNIRNSVDNIYHLKKLSNNDPFLDVLLITEKDRANITDHALRIDTKKLDFTYLDMTNAMMTEEIEEFVHEVKEALRNSEDELNKTELLNAVGRKKDDKTARNWLDRFDGKYWQSKKAGGVFTYQIISS